jgi:hypothetical protein
MFDSPKRGAKGNAATNNVTNPYWMTAIRRDLVLKKSFQWNIFQ